MKLLVVLATFAQVALSGHVAVRMPYLNPANVQYGPHASYNYEYAQQAFGYGDPYQQHQHVAHAPVAYTNAQIQYDDHVSYHAKAPAAIGYAQVPVKTAVAVPTVHHVPAVADVPYTKIEAQPAVVQKLVDVAKPAIKTRKYEVRRPAIQKQFYDIEERTIVRPVGSALLELDEPLSQGQKGPAVVSSLDGHHHTYVDEDHHHHHHDGIAVTAAPLAHHVAVTPTVHTVAITPTPHAYVSTVAPHHHHHHHHQEVPVAYKKIHVDTPYLHKQHHEQVLVSTTPSPIHYSTEPVLVSSTPVPHYSADDTIIVEAAARHAAAAEHAAYEAKLVHEEAVAHAHINAKNAHLAVEAFSNGSPYEHHEHKIVTPHEVVKNLNHLTHEQAQVNQHRLLKLLTARGGVAEVGFERPGHSEYVGDAGISHARVLSATPSPHHEPVEEKVKTRRIVVSRPVQTLQEIDVVEPVTKVERIAVNQPTVIKTAKVGVERVHTSVPVYGKAYAPAIAHAQVPVEYYH